MNDYILQVKVKNGPLLRAMRQEGYHTASELSRASGVRLTEVCQFLNLTKSAIAPSSGEWRTGLVRISECLRRLPEDLFPPQHLMDCLKSTGQMEVTIGLDEIEALVAGGDMDAVIDQRTIISKVREAMDSRLTPRERQILVARFGLDDCDPKNMSEVGRALETPISRCRVMQIEHEAIRKLKSAFNEKAVKSPPNARHYHEAYAAI